MATIHNNIKEIVLNEYESKVEKRNEEIFIKLSEQNKSDNPYYINIFYGFLNNVRCMRTKTVFNNDQMKTELRNKYQSLLNMSINQKLIIKGITINVKNVV
jgi:hypothetical protein